MSTAKNGKGKQREDETDSSAPRSQAATNQSGTTGNSNVDRVISSASSLLQSFTKPSANEASHGLTSAVGAPKGQSSQWRGTSTRAAGSSRGEESALSGALNTGVQGDVRTAAGASGFRVQEPTTFEAANADFRDFSANTSNFAAVNPTHSGTRQAPDYLPQPGQGENIMDLLSGPLTAAVWAPDIPDDSTTLPQPLPPRSNPYLNDFVEAEDIVAFLSRKDVEYTEEVWGDMLGLISQARQETEEQGKEEVVNDRAESALARLKMLQRQLKSKL